MVEAPRENLKVTDDFGLRLAEALLRDRAAAGAAPAPFMAATGKA